MKFLVIGQSVVDKIRLGNILQVKPGGIFYTAISLFSLLEESDKLFLCTTVDKSHYELFSFIYDKVEDEFILSSERIPVVNLIIKNAAERDEVYENISANIDIDFNDLNRFDGILINMITGFDISIKQMQRLRENYNGIIYFDVHTLSRGLSDNYKRVFRPVPKFFEWAECIDILQANSYELKTLCDRRNEYGIAEELLDWGIKQVIVTRGSGGSILYYEEDGNIKTITQEALQTHTVNEVGCGDVFGAVYFYNYIRNKNVCDALLFANTAAGLSTTYSKVEDLLKIKEDVREQLN